MSDTKGKYRGLRKCDGERDWVYGYYFAIDSRHFIVDEQAKFILMNPMHITSTVNRFNLYNFVEVRPDTVGQYIGRKDEGGKEIYEGDIVSVNKDCYAVSHGEWGRNKDVVKMGLRTWLKHEQFGYEGENLIDPDECEVIGNIHEHPELMEGKK